MMKWLMRLFMTKESLFEMMTYKVQSKKEITDIADGFSKACEKYKFALLHEYVYHEIVESKGFPIERKVYIYEICQAKVAALVLTDEPDFAPFMPCRIALYEENNQVSVSTQNMQMILDTLGDNKALQTQTSELFTLLKQLINEIK
ncbi:DUF302 domain-containing protein [Sulfurimonas sp. MAG313]|nr:DUF302 domain-containing protein [Sulfurimonas sp. MAG313]MDF1880068.1 DUF302 domain-containing protein [Sulfurimonas sp. MAG313]